MDTKQFYETHGQEQVFRFWEELGEQQRASLLEQAAEIDLEEVDRLVANLLRNEGGEAKIDFSTLKPAPYLPIPEDIESDPAWQEALTLGEDALRAGKVAAFTVAGGQGTRLGYDGPKGTFPVTPIKGKTLFQVFAEKIQAGRLKYQATIPWYVMTSHINHEATVSFFEENDYFGLGSDSVRFFRQGRMPAVDFEGRIILEGKDRIAMSPDGHGGALRALERSGSLQEMQDAGVEVISYFQVDNPLVRPIDPHFIGFHLKSGSTMSSKMLPKAYEKEKLGHFCLQGDKTVIVEYSDMPDELCAARDADGQLSFRAGSIAIHIISLSFARSLASDSSVSALPFHRADKKVPFVDEAGATQKPEQPNGVKFEMFVFDAIPFATSPLVLETTRLDDFSPVKNAEGIDSPESSRKDQVSLFRSWLEAAGVTLPSDFAGQVEISPLYASTREDFLKAWKSAPRELDLSGDIFIG